jgi:hypothetical protein
LPPNSSPNGPAPDVKAKGSTYLKPMAIWFGDYVDGELCFEWTLFVTQLGFKPSLERSIRDRGNNSVELLLQLKFGFWRYKWFPHYG